MATVLFPPDWASPGAIGSTTPNTGAFTTATTTGTLTVASVAQVSSAGYSVFPNVVLYAGSGLSYSIAGVSLSSVSAVMWGASNFLSTPDTYIFRNAANQLIQRNSTNPQAHFWANTWTSATDNELGYARWASNEFRIGTEKGSGGGTARGWALQTDATTRLSISATGSLIFASPAAPANASATGTAGEIRTDADYIYVCTATDTWKRSALSTW